MANFVRVTVLGIGALAAIALSGCVGGPPAAVVTPAPSESPVFASEEEALTAATEAYAAYLAVSDMITAKEGDQPERIGPLVTAGYRQQEVEGFEEFRRAGLSTRGQSRFDSLQLQQDPSSLLVADTFTTYICSDVGLVRIQDDDGIDVTPPSRPDRIPLEVDFHIASDAPVVLLIERSDVWTGENFC